MEHMGRVIKLLAFLAVSVAVWSCGAYKHAGSTVNVRDSVSVHWVDSVRYKDVTVVRDSVVNVYVPVEQSIANNPLYRPSHLETSVAESDAYVDSLGLHHTLKNKSGNALPAHVPVTDHYHSEEHVQQKDSTSTHDSVREDTFIEELTRWQKFRINAFWWLVALAVIGFRKEILAIIKKIVNFAIWHKHTTT